jgi:uncharacterized protein (TIGR02145 family)
MEEKTNNLLANFTVDKTTLIKNAYKTEKLKTCRMKNKSTYFILALLPSLLFLSGCKKSNDAQVPEIITSAIDIITPVSARCISNITSNGGAALTATGVCWSTDSVPDINNNKTTGGTNIGEFTIIITGLDPQTHYYARAYAENSAGVAYGKELEFTTPQDLTGETGTLQDTDGNTYATIGIGGQMWMAGNLKTTLYNDGTPIPRVTDNTAWSSLKNPGFCWYNNDSLTNSDSYGALYNWYAAFSPNLAPDGWHVPTDADWVTLSQFLGGMDVAGGKVKTTGNTWDSPNTGATNESGFNSRPGGLRTSSGIFSSVTDSSAYWTVSSASGINAWYWTQNNQDAKMGRTAGNLSTGCSIRLVKDN